jgi:hypothetical protein
MLFLLLQFVITIKVMGPIQPIIFNDEDEDLSRHSKDNRHKVICQLNLQDIHHKVIRKLLVLIRIFHKVNLIPKV